MNKRCSIIIPTYNNSVEQYIRLFNSINRQTALDAIYVIIVDDASTLGILTEDFIHENLNCEFELIRLNKNRGAGYARQIALDKSKEISEYFCLIDSDDELYDDKTIENYLIHLDEHKDIDIVCGQEYNAMVKDVYCGFGLHGACGRREVLDYCFYPSTHYAEDFCFLIMIELYEIKTEVLPFISYVRNPGYLTYNVISLFAILSGYNSMHIMIQVVSHLKNLKNSPAFEDIRKNIIVNQLIQTHYSLKHLEDKEHFETDDWLKTETDVFARNPSITPERYEIISLYYYLIMLRVIPKNLLKEYFLADEYANHGYGRPAELISHIGEILLDKQIWYVPYYGKMSFEEIENEFKRIIKELEQISKKHIAEHPEEDSRLPQQVLDSFPYHYKIYS